MIERSALLSHIEKRTYYLLSLAAGSIAFVVIATDDLQPGWQNWLLVFALLLLAVSIFSGLFVLRGIEIHLMIGELENDTDDLRDRTDFVQDSFRYYQMLSVSVGAIAVGFWAVSRCSKCTEQMISNLTAIVY